MPMTQHRKASLYYFLGTVFSIVPVSAAVLSYFPLWRNRGAQAVLSGFTLLLLVLSLVPLIRVVKSKLRSPAAHTLWFIVFVFFYAFSMIADELIVISFIGFISNLIAMVLFRLAKRARRKESKQNEKI